jgi:hypothetical protein
MSLKNHHIENLLLEIEKRNGKSFSLRQHVMYLIEDSCLSEMSDTFYRLIFLGKFLHNTNNMINRIGKEGEGYEKLLDEFIDHAYEVVNILKKIIDVTSEQIRNELKNYMNIQTVSGFKNFIKLMEDLSWLKNYELDSNRKICEDLK